MSIDKSHLSDPTRLARLLFASSLAYIWLIHLGMLVFQDESLRSLIDRTHRTDKSLFRLGLDWVKLFDDSWFGYCGCLSFVWATCTNLTVW